MPSVSRTLWSVINTPMPRSLRCATRSRMSLTAIGSMPASGSSKRMKCGWVASARAISHRRRSPPDSAIAAARRRWRIEHLLAQLGFGLGDFEDGADILLDRQTAKDRGFLRQITDAAAGAAVHRQ